MEKRKKDTPVLISMLPAETLEDTKRINPEALREVFRAIRFLMILTAVLFCFHSLVAQQAQVIGSSMEETLHDGDHIFLEKLSYRFGEPKRFDIIVFHPGSGENQIRYIKRIIGLPGETIRIEEGRIVINGSYLEEAYGKEEIKDSGIASEPIILGEDEYFVLGDNRNNSRDSRDTLVGVVKKKEIIGRAFWRVWPFNRISLLLPQRP